MLDKAELYARAGVRRTLTGLYVKPANADGGFRSPTWGANGTNIVKCRHAGQPRAHCQFRSHRHEDTMAYSRLVFFALAVTPLSWGFPKATGGQLCLELTIPLSSFCVESYGAW